jgi:tRNA threonylcarbamoyladenosine biosynthesis protein TsaB
MKILAFDTTNATLSVAILFDKKLVAGKNIFEENKHSEMLVPVIEECLKQAKIWYQDLDLIAFTNGPGSFTGVRVGYSCAKALEIATALPIVAINSLEAIAYDYILEDCQKILVVSDAKLDEFFIQEFDVVNNQLKAMNQPQLISDKEIANYFPKEKFILAGSAKTLVKNPKNAVVFSKQDFIDAKNIALLAEKIKHNNVGKALYIREPKISVRKDAK